MFKMGVMKTINNCLFTIIQATEYVEKHRVPARSMKQTLNFELSSAGNHCNITQISQGRKHG